MRRDSAAAPLAWGTEIDLPTDSEWEDGMARVVAGVVEFDEATHCVYVAPSPVRPGRLRAARHDFV